MQLLSILKSAPEGAISPLTAKDEQISEGPLQGSEGDFSGLLQGLWGLPKGDGSEAPLKGLDLAISGDFVGSEGDFSGVRQGQWLLHKGESSEDQMSGLNLEISDSLVLNLESFAEQLQGLAALKDELPPEAVEPVLEGLEALISELSMLPEAAVAELDASGLGGALEKIQGVLSDLIMEADKTLAQSADKHSVLDQGAGQVLEQLASVQDALVKVSTVLEPLIRAVPVTVPTQAQVQLQTPVEVQTQIQTPVQVQIQVHAPVQAQAHSGNELPPNARGGIPLPAQAGEFEMIGERVGPSVLPMMRSALGLQRAGDTPLTTKGSLDSMTDSEKLDIDISKLAFKLASGDGNSLRPDPERLQQALSQLNQTLGERSMPTGSASELVVNPALGSTTAGTSVRGGVAAPALQFAIATAPGEAGWNKALGERVMWMVGRGVQSAEIRLNPPELGPLAIRVALQNDQASITFTAQHPYTREALEAAIPRLRDLMQESNLNLVNVDVGQNDGGDPRRPRADQEVFAGTSGPTASMPVEEVADEPRSVLRSQGFVDDFA